MKLIFIGTSHGVPETNRRCSSCFLEVNEDYYIIDMGSHIVEDLQNRGISMDQVRLAICSHPHGDHTNGLISFVDLLNWYFKTADPLILIPDGRLLPPLRAWVIASTEGKPLRDGLRIETFSEGVAYQDDNLRITAIRTKHCEYSYAFLIEAENKSILFTNDLSRTLVDFPQIPSGKKLDLLICEGAHFSPEDGIAFFDESKANRVLFNHVNDKRWGGVLSRLMDEPHPYELGVAFDGLEVDL